MVEFALNFLTSIFEVRLWRKNRAPTHCIRDQWGRERCCKGVDLNRNFDFHFKGLFSKFFI